MWDTMLMIYHKPFLLVISLLFIIFAGSFNIFCMCVVAFTSSLNQAIIDALWTLLIWICILVSYQIGLPFGEKWNKYSFVELSGFLFLVTGNFIFNNVLLLPFFKYRRYWSEENTLLDNGFQRESIIDLYIYN